MEVRNRHEKWVSNNDSDGTTSLRVNSSELEKAWLKIR